MNSEETPAPVPSESDSSLAERDVTPTPSQAIHVNRRIAALRHIVDRNPFYLLSALCMLGGCLALTNSLSWVTVPLPRLLLLTLTLNLYEGVLIGLAILLLRRGLLRDGNILLLIEAFFLVDVTFLYTEIATRDLRLGMMFAPALVIITAIKLLFILRARNIHLTRGETGFLFMQLVLLVAIPDLLRHLDHGAIPAISFYALWWMVGLMPAARELLCPERLSTAPRSHVAALYLALPWYSLIAHVGVLHYVYDVPFIGAMATPVLLGLALALHRAAPAGNAGRQDVAWLKALLPLAAIIVSLNNPLNLASYWGGAHLGIWLTPVRLAIAGAYLTYIYIFFIAIAQWLLLLGALAALWQLAGPSWVTVGKSTQRVYEIACNAIMSVVPTTLTAWGMVSVIASFVFLLLGLKISLSRPREAT